ncbi:telomeric single stranded DNA binding POT1/CDC13 domain-containing protein [Hirsutella rhossiliensis]|uniref:Telomeric single stranded DNA binding POT1/CDC13 domain-containing protein n=1 Tax=Hirsutella rhossiliensis TaxID=111463 RepID=A0A9P8N1C6_9HYPO|nr:telomeric single stranded DNA binding POT1/CDC13 domain-containing protein [Hirsutella rhossiliensis]KAH0965049.1 telomeric single stranded DNA binding POT1/CDC13 domain-containing protein [Hirsutella rhossiliensis]
MADAQSALEVLRRTDATPIAQLHPDIDDALSRVVDGVVTVTWPHSVVTKSIAFILAEHDFRLRRDKGQLRIELHGPAAQALAESTIGGGDEARISLDGAQWEKHQAPTRLPGGTLEWQLKFSNRLLLEVRRAQDQGNDFIQVDAPEDQEPQPEPKSPLADRLNPSPPDAQSQRDHAMPLAIPDVVATPSSSLPAKRPASSTFGPDEYASPAFLKRARVSYGSLFEGGLDMFDEEKETKTKGKRRPRFSMQNTTWRYTSRSPSPEADTPSDHESDVGDRPGRDEEAQASAGTPKASPPRPSMVDEACQTQEVYFSPSQMEAQILAESHVPGSMLQPASTSGPPGQRQDQAGFQTPSRTLFDRGRGQRDVLRIAEEPDMAYETAGSHGHDFGLGAEQHVGSANMLGAPPVATSATSPAVFTEGISAPGYPPAVFDGNHLDATALNIDPSLQFPGAIPVPDHVYFDAPPPGHVEWHAEPLAAGRAWVPVQASSQSPAVAVFGSSPLRRQPHSISSGSRNSNGSELGPNLASGSGEEAFQGGFAGETAEAETTGRDDADARDIPGEDYDLRNYDRARDDDEEESEESEPGGSDVEQQAIDLSEEDEEDELHGQAPETEQYSEAGYGVESVHRGPGAGEDAGYLSSDDEDDSDDEAQVLNGLEEDDGEARYYDQEDEDGYDGLYGGEEEEESEEYGSAFNAAPRATAPQEPVFISLLSDSEDEQESQAEPGPPSISPPLVRDSMPLNGPVGGVLPETANSAELQRDSESSANSSLDVNEDESPGLDAAGRVHTHQGLEMEPMPSQPAPSAFLEASEYTHQSASDNASVHDDSEIEEERQPEGDGRYQDTEVNGEEPITTAAAEAVSSEPMDVDEEPGDEAPSDQVPINEAPGNEAQTSPPMGEDPRPQAGQLEALVQDKPADGEAIEIPLEHQQTAVEIFESQPLEPQGIEGEEQVLTEASDSLGQDALPNESSEYHQTDLQTADADVVSVVTEVEQVHDESSISGTHPNDSEDLATLEALKAAVPGGCVEQLPTPSETQPKEDTAALVDAENQVTEEGEDDRAAQAQIMTEYQEYYTPTKQNTTRPSPGKAQDKGQVKGGDQEPEALITVKSLRSRGHRRTRSGDTNSQSHEDPSVLLAKASACRPSGPKPGAEPKSPTRLRVAGNRGDASDPSLLLAKASASEPAHPKDHQSPTTSRAASGTADEAATVMPSAGASSSSPRGKRRHATPEVTRELRSKPHDAARRNTPDAVAETILKSPSVAGSLEDEDVAAMKRNLQKTLRTALPDFLPLRSLRSSLNKTVDILAMSTLTPPQPHRPKHGPRDYMLELILTDPSTAPTSVVVAHLFRPHQTSLPVVKAGDVVLLRRVQVVSVKGRGFGARAGDTSAWAVFEKDDEEMLPQIKGPPVEVTDAEIEHAQGLRRWWAMQGEGAMAKVDKATQKASQAGKGDAR